MQVCFHGVRGSIAVSSPKVVHTGGNTACVEVLAEGERLILDAGTGLRALGESLGVRPIQATIVFSHVHWDHIQGFPFFLPAFHPDSKLRMVGAPSLRDALAAQMKPPAFPITLDAIRAELTWVTAAWLEVGPFRLRGVPVPHPDPCQAWRIEAGGRSMVYATDTELGGTTPAALASLSEGADLLVLDAQYTAAELPTKRGWGHSSWEEAVGFSEAVSARRLALFHHDPSRSDEAVAAMEAQAKDRLPGTMAAREGLELRL